MAATRRQERELIMKYEKAKHTAKTPVERLQAYVFSSGVTGIKSLGRIFRIIDKNGDRKIDFQEFKDAIDMAGIEVDHQIERECFDQMDTEKNGVLSFDEFLIALRPPMSANRKKLIKMAFHKFDKDGNGVIDVEDMKGVYSARQHPKYLSGEWTEEQCFIEWLNSFNGPDKFDGTISKEDFENYYAGVSASIDSDAYFDLMMRKAWKL